MQWMRTYQMASSDDMLIMTPRDLDTSTFFC